MLVVLILSVLLVPYVQGSLLLSPAPGATYRLGDALAGGVQISSLTQNGGIVSASVICSSYRLDYFASPFTFTNASAVLVTFPTIPITTQMQGTCKLSITLKSFDSAIIETLDSFPFVVSATLVGTSSVDRPFVSPGEEMTVHVQLASSGTYQGTYRFSSNDLEGGSFSFQGSAWTETFTLPSTAPARVESLSITLNDSAGNSYASTIPFTIRSVARGLPYVYTGNASVLPGMNISISGRVEDQTGRPLNESISVLFFDPGGVSFGARVLASEEEGIQYIAPSTPPGLYRIQLQSAGLTNSTTYTVSPYTFLRAELVGSSLSITNEGNVPFTQQGVLRATQGAYTYTVPVRFDLLPGDRTSVALEEELPPGTYDLSFTGNQQAFTFAPSLEEDARSLSKKVSQQISILTGQSVIDTSNTRSSTLLLVTSILLLLGGIYLAQRRFRTGIHTHIDSVVGGQQATIGKLHTHLAQEQTEHARLHALFGKYVDQKVLSHVQSGDKGVMEKKEVVVLFTDLRGFSSLFAQHDPVQISMMVDMYLTAVSEAVHAEGGIINKFVGDAAMALFNVPHPQSDPALRALRAGLAIKRACARLNERLQKKGLPRLDVGIGVVRGEAAVGLVGSKERMEYTALGAPINLAARLQAQARGGKVLTDEHTYRPLAARLDVVSLGRMALKHVQPTQVYEVVQVRGA